MMTIQNYRRPATLEEAWELRQKRGSRILGGMMWMRLSNRTIPTAIDLSGLGLDTIEETEDSFRIGAMVSLRQMETHAALNACTNGCLREAVRHIVGVQFRNTATVGGSVAGRFGFSDVLTAFLAYGAEVELYKAGRVPMSEFVKTGCGTDILTAVILPKQAGTYFYQTVRATETDFPVLACAAAKIGDEVRIAIGARPARAMLLTYPAAALDDAALADTVAAAVPTYSNLRGSAAYRTRLVKVLTRRAAAALKGDAVC